MPVTKSSGGALKIVLVLVCCLLWRDREPKFWKLFGSLVLGMVFVFAGFQAWALTITLSSDAIELRTLFDRKVLRLDSIGGRREFVKRDSEGDVTYYLRLVSKDPHVPQLDFQKAITLMSTSICGSINCRIWSLRQAEG